MQQLELNENSVIEVVNSDKVSYKLYFNYNTTRQSWFVDVISEDFKICGIKVLCMPNILRQWQSKLKFGIGIVADNELDPFFSQDFAAERARIFLIEPQDLDAQNILYNSFDYE